MLGTMTVCISSFSSRLNFLITKEVALRRVMKKRQQCMNTQTNHRPVI